MRARWPQLRSILRPCLVALAILFLAQVAWACPTCKAGLGAHDPAHGDLVGAYMWSILFMMSMPFTLLASLGGYFYWLVRKARAAAELPAAMAQDVKAPAVETQSANSPPAFASAQGREAVESETVHA